MLRANNMTLRSPWSLPPGRTVPVALTFLAASLIIQLGIVGLGLHRKNAGGASSSTLNLLRIDPALSPDASSGVSALLVQPRADTLTIRAPWQELLEESRASAAHQKPEAAFKALNEAEKHLPQQPGALAEMAVQYEKMGSPDQAIKLWEMVYKFGPAAGVYFQAADAKLSILRDHASAAPTPSPLALPKPGLLRFGKFVSSDSADNTTSRRIFTLNVPVQRAEGSSIDASDVFIQVQFYDQINGITLERTSASVTWKWANPLVNWTTSRTQTLQVGYRQGPKKNPKEVRRYFGYVASVYYKDKLLDTRAEPPRLGQQYPPPRMISKEVSP